MNILFFRRNYVVFFFLITACGNGLSVQDASHLSDGTEQTNLLEKCVPSCLASLFSRCMPVGVCSTVSVNLTDSQGLQIRRTSRCYSEGRKVFEERTSSGSFTVVTGMDGMSPCYSVNRSSKSYPDAMFDDIGYNPEDSPLGGATIYFKSRKPFADSSYEYPTAGEGVCMLSDGGGGVRVPVDFLSPACMPFIEQKLRIAVADPNQECIPAEPGTCPENVDPVELAGWFRP